MGVETVGNKIPVLIRAPIDDVSGYAAHARDMCLAIERSGKFKARLEPLHWSVHSYVELPPEDREDLEQMQARQMDIVEEEGMFITMSVPHEFQITPKTINVGITAGIEVDRASQRWAQACNNMHATIVSSRFSMKGLMEAGVQAPLFVVGEGVEPFPEEYLEGQLAELDNIETDFNFFTAGQWGGMQTTLGEDRKDMGNLILHFLKTFSGKRDVGLIIKTYGQNDSTPDWVYTKRRIESLRERAGVGKYPLIHLVHGVLTQAQLAQLYHHPKVKAFVTTTHGECWGRHIAEAAAAGLPILATGWSAHTEYLSSNHSVFFEHKLEEVPQGAIWQGVIDPGTKWAVCEYEHVSRMMRRCVSKYDIAKEKALEQRDFILERHSREQAMDELVDTLEKIWRQHKAKAAGIETGLKGPGGPVPELV